MIQPLSARKKACFSGQVAMVIPDSWSSGNVAGKYAGQPLKASCASYAEELAPPALCPSQISSHYLVYLPPTNPSVATLILTSGGKTVRRAVKQAIKVEPVVNTSSTMIRCLIPLRLS